MMARTYDVESIHCAGCEAGIRQAVGSLAGVIDLHPDRRTNEVRVRFDETQVTEDALAAALAHAGFPVRSVRPSDAAERAAVEHAQVPRASIRAEREVEVVARTEPTGSEPSGGGRYAIFVLGVIVAALAGYIGYVLYPRFDLPSVQGAGLLVLAAAAGFASFFSPCSFPLLLGLLGRQAVAQTRGGEAARPVVFGGALAAGAGTFLLLTGIVIALGGRALFAGVTFTSPAGITIRGLVGGLLVLLGLIQVGMLPFSLHAVSTLARPLARWQAHLRRERPAAGFAVFGFGYVLAGFG